ncbi:Uncharacterized protein DBV15_00122, partial [Temnothorax longispinosus]
IANKKRRRLMHLTRAISYIALTLFARKSSRKCHTVRTFGLTAVTKAEEEKDDRNKEEEGEKEKKGGEERMCGEGGKRSYAKNLKLSRRERGKERPMVTGPRETESAPAYNLKTHSAFKLLTMAAGYKEKTLLGEMKEGAKKQEISAKL